MHAPSAQMPGMRHHHMAAHHAHIPGAPVPMPQQMMAPYLMNGTQVGGPMYAYPGVQPMEAHEPGTRDMLQYFAPVDLTMQPFSSRPQARNGRLLTSTDITPELVGKQAEMLWPDDAKWYLIRITHVDIQHRSCNIQYLTGETESGLQLDEIVQKKELRIIPS
jgi:hypothetical protein